MWVLRGGEVMMVTTVVVESGYGGDDGCGWSGSGCDSDDKGWWVWLRCRTTMWSDEDDYGSGDLGGGGCCGNNDNNDSLVEWWWWRWKWWLRVVFMVDVARDDNDGGNNEYCCSGDLSAGGSGW